MPLTEMDPNVSGRNSRASNFSGSYKDVRKPSGGLLSVNPGVLGMLKTSTESGDLDTPSLKSSRVPKRPHAPSRHASGMTRSSSQHSQVGSLKTLRSSILDGEDPSMPGSWPFNRHAHLQNHELRHAHSDGLYSNYDGSTKSLASAPIDRFVQNGRSYSMASSVHPSRSLSNHRSMASLRSQPPQLRPHSPKIYANRLRRPDYRPPSPALSENNGVLRSRLRGPMPWPEQRTPGPFPMQPSNTNHYIYRQGYHSPDLPALPNYPLNEVTKTFGPGNRVLISPSNEVPHTWRVAPTSAVLLQQTHANPNQQFRATPSPLHRHYTGHIETATNKSATSNAAPYVGFVQRVKTVLEERTLAEDANLKEKLQKAASNMLNEVEAVVAELPASPVGKRLTREMIKSIVKVDSSPDFLSNSTLDGNKLDVDMVETVAEIDLVPDHEEALPERDSRPTPELARRLTRDVIRAAVEPSSGPVSSSSQEVFDSSFLAAQDDEQSSEEGSSISDVSGEVLRSASTPDQQAQPQSVHSEATTNVSSLETPANRRDITVRLTMPTMPSPKISLDGHKKSKSATSLIEPAVGNSAPSDKSSRPQSTLNTGQGHGSNANDVPLEKPHKATDLPGAPPEASHSATIDFTATRSAVTEKDEAIGSVLLTLTANSYAQLPAHNEKMSHSPDLRKSESTARPPSWATTSILNRDSYAPSRFTDLPVSEANTLSSRHSLAYPPSTAFSNDKSSRPETTFLGSTEAWSHSHQSASYTAEAKLRSTSTAVEFRISGLKQFNFPLPDLTEDSQEDASTTNLRLLGAVKRPVFRSGGMRAARGEAKYLHRASAPPEPPRSYFSTRALSQTRNIPSLNFSHVDLTTTLNHALGFRSSRSLEHMSRSRHGSLPSRIIERRASATTLRERYRSFFPTNTGDAVEEADHKKAMVIPDKRQSWMSQEEILTEINRLSIPSVNNLTLRLSELLPSIKLQDFAENMTDNVEHTMQTPEGLQETEMPGGMSSTASGPDPNSATSANKPGLEATLAGRLDTADMQHCNDMTKLGLMKDLPPLPRDESRPSMKLASTSRSVRSGQPQALPIASLYGSKNASLAEPDVPEIHELGEPSPRKLRLKRPSNRKLNGINQTREEGIGSPWRDKAMTSEAVGLMRHDGTRSPGPRIVAKQSKSTMRSQVDDTLRIVRSMSPGFDADLVPTAAVPSTSDLQVSPMKKKFFSSLTKKIGIKPRIDKAGFPIDPMFLHPEDRSHDPGDRYPTSGLTSPAGMHIEETRSYFSDDTSQHSNNVKSLRKRLTKLKPKLSASHAISSGDSRSELHHIIVQAPLDESVFDETTTDFDRQQNLMFMYEETPHGMSKLEFHTKSVIEKLRKLWYKSGEIIRCASRAQKRPTQWYAGSEVYAGA